MKLELVETEWVMWAGGECPVDANEKVYIRIRSSAVNSLPFCAGALIWEHRTLENGDGHFGDIVAYRVAIENE